MVVSSNISRQDSAITHMVQSNICKICADMPELPGAIAVDSSKHGPSPKEQRLSSVFASKDEVEHFPSRQKT